MDKDLYEVLGVAANAEQRDIKKAYFQKVREFPPETHAEQFQQVRKAYETLSDPDRRRAYDASRGDAWSALGQELAAVMRSASEAMQKEEYDNAARLLEAVVAQRPEAEEPRARLCGCLLNLEQWSRALVAAQAFIDQHPRSVLAHLLKGWAANGAGQLITARDAFLKALELDPNDFRAYRGVVDTHFNDGRPSNALTWLEEVAEQPTERDARRAVMMELVALRVHLGQEPEGLEALGQEAKDDEREEFRRFGERLVTIALGRSTGKAPALLTRLRALGVQSDLLNLASTTTLPVADLSSGTRSWLERQRKQPDIFFLPGTGSAADALVAAGGVALLVALSWLLFTSRTAIDWDFGAKIAVAYAGAGVFAGWACVRLVRSLASPLGRFTCLHPVWLIEVDLDHAHFKPLAATRVVNATHQHTNGAYTHSVFTLSFGDSNATVSMNSKQHAEQFLELVQHARQRLLDLGHSGLVGAVEGLDLVSAAQRGSKARVPWLRRRELAGGLTGALLGLLVVVTGSALSNTRAEAAEFSNALADPRSPQAAWVFLQKHPEGEHAVQAAAETARRRAALVAELRPTGAGLADALAAHAEPSALAVKVVFVPTVAAVPPMATTEKGRVVAEVPPDLYSAERRRRFEQLLLARMQAAFDRRFGAEWVTFSSTAGTPVLTITYRLGVSGRAFGLWSEDPGKRSDVLWVEPQAAVSASLGATRVEATLTPPPSVALRPELARELQVRGAEALYVPLTDSLWQSVIDFVGRAVGLTSTLPG